MRLLRRIFCQHDFQVECWHFTHGPYGNEPRYIEGIEQCTKCGKRKYFWVERGSTLETHIIEHMKGRYKP